MVRAVIIYSVPDAGTIPSLIKMAYDTSRINGYNEAGKRSAGGVNIQLNIEAGSVTQDFSLIFRAPVS
jgi:hypothetical protein